VKKFLVVVEFLIGPYGRIFYMAHVFSLKAPFSGPTKVLEVTVTADTPEEALAEGEFLAWLLSR